MTFTLKRWLRTRKYHLVIYIIIFFCFTCYINVNNDLHHGQHLDFMKRNTVIDYIENTLEEAFEYDKRARCEIPKLDPFAKEVMEFDKKIPKVVCDGQDWVRCYLTECRVVKEILDTTRDIVCLYRDIIYVNDRKHYLGPMSYVLNDDVYVLTKSDHVKIKCTGIRSGSLIGSKWIGHSVGFRKSVDRKLSPRDRQNSINILIFGFDSTSKNGFIRKMPKSFKLLTRELGGVVLNGYNIVGDGTIAALLPLLTGKNELELPDVRRSSKTNHTLESMPLMFYKLKEDGYRTAYFEDMPDIGTFQYRFNGFLRQPTDHYVYAFFKTVMANRKKVDYCVGDTPQYRLMMDITDQFFKLDGKRFCFTFIGDITHDNFSMISTADEDMVQFLSKFKKQGHLNDTLLIVMGDHGTRYSKLRNTYQGKLEERLALMVFVLPKTLTRSRLDILPALIHNANTLTTPYDIHTTIYDALGLRDHWNPYKIKGAELTRGLTLFRKIPNNRTCSEAGIQPHWCACLKWTNISRMDPLYNKSSYALVDYINRLTKPVRLKCAVRVLSDVIWVSRAEANTKLMTYKGSNDNDGYVGKFGDRVQVQRENLQIKVSVTPGQGIFEASMVYLRKEDKFVFDSREISRTNAYNNEPKCISSSHPHLNMFCYCINFNE